MLIIQDKILINLDNLFSMTIGGQGDRYLICKGSGSLETHLVFASNPEAIKARDIITSHYALKNAYCYINDVLQTQAEIETTKPKRKKAAGK